MMKSSAFQIGDRVSLRRNISERGRIDVVANTKGGHQFYEVLLDSGALEVFGEHELHAEVLIRTPWDLLSQNALRDHRNFSISTTIHKVRNTTANTISSLKASRTIFYPYQYKPLVKFLKSDTKRILVADEVGLGKTIEAGHIMLELAARGNLKNVLVVCTNSLKDKWRAEIADKFNFILKRYSTTKEFIEDLSVDIDGTRRNVFGILNYEKCRNLELQDVLDKSGYKFDLLICDEAHKLRNSDTAQHKGVAKIVEHSEAVVFLTATPIMTEIRNLYNLIRMLDKDGYDTFDIFNNAIAVNRPFIQALSDLRRNEPMRSVAEKLNDTMVLQQMTADDEVYEESRSSIEELFINDPLYSRVLKNMHAGDESLQNRVTVQQDLLELNSLNHLYSRTRKKDVLSSDNVVQRNPRSIVITLSKIERGIYDSVINEYDDQNNLGLITRKRQMSSCIVAFRTPRESLLRGQYDKEIPDAKYQAFKSIINEVIKKDKKIIVFAFFTNTLLYLKNKLQEENIGTAIIYGGIDDRTERIDEFQHNDQIKILLSSEVGSEGIDLQFCDAIVNYDLPWNPMVVEQRIGRIDRVGQKSSVINIYNLIIEDTIEERIHNRLYERINLFRESLGDLEEILGETERIGELITRGIESLYKVRLSEREQLDELDRLSLAIENEKQNLNKIKTDLESSFANDVHFQNEVERIDKNNRYLTRSEITNYVESIIREELSSLQLRHLNESISELEIPPNSKDVLFNFIEKHKDSSVMNPEINKLYRKFKQQNYGATRIRLTFDQQTAYEYKTIEFVSAYHPLLNAITNFYDKKGYDKNQAHKLSIRKEEIQSIDEINQGYYLLAVYRILVGKDFGDGRKNEIIHLRSTTADLNGESVSILNRESSDLLFGVAQTKSKPISNDLTFDREFIKEVRPCIMSKMKEDEIEVGEDEKVKFSSLIKRRTDQEVNYIESRINRLTDQLNKGNVPEHIWKKNIEDFETRKQKLLENKKASKLEVSHMLVSVNLVQVI